jgi:penicillin-binding protein 2
MRRIIGLGLSLGLLGASCSTAAPPAARQAPKPPADTGAVTATSDAQAAVDALLATSVAPAAVVVLSLDPEPRVLALGRHGGADPTGQLIMPGSTVKPLVAFIAAEAGVYHAGDVIGCPREFSGAEHFHCYADHGDLDLTHAIEVSCNDYFGELGLRLGLARLDAGFARFTLSTATGLVPGERVGFVADGAWASAHSEAEIKRWEVLVGAGHGPIQVTVLELAAAYAKLAREVARPSGRIPEAVRAELEAGLRAVVASPGGTGHRAFVPGLEIAGKTGTAQQADFVVGGGEGDGPDNGWFVGFTPVKAPKTLVAAVVIGAGGGGQTAAPLVGEIFKRIAVPGAPGGG